MVAGCGGFRPCGSPTIKRPCRGRRRRGIRRPEGPDHAAPGEGGSSEAIPGASGSKITGGRERPARPGLVNARPRPGSRPTSTGRSLRFFASAFFVLAFGGRGATGVTATHASRRSEGIRPGNPGRADIETDEQGSAMATATGGPIVVHRAWNEPLPAYGQPASTASSTASGVCPHVLHPFRDQYSGSSFTSWFS